MTSKICQNCGEMNRQQANFCLDCGSSFASQLPERGYKSKTCQNCGHINRQKANFCKSCGLPFTGQPTKKGNTYTTRTPVQVHFPTSPLSQKTTEIFREPKLLDRLDKIEDSLQWFFEDLLPFHVGGELQPVDLFKYIKSEMKQQRMLCPGGIVVPNRYELKISKRDHERFKNSAPPSF